MSSGAVIISSMHRGDRVALKHFEQWIDRLARRLAIVINLLDPELIVFGGGLSKISELYTWLPRALAHMFADAWMARLRPAKRGDALGVRGAARL